MTTTVFDTQRVCLDLMKELLKVKEQKERETDLETRVKLERDERWLKNKLAFLESDEYQNRKMSMD